MSAAAAAAGAAAVATASGGVRIAGGSREGGGERGGESGASLVSCDEDLGGILSIQDAQTLTMQARNLSLEHAIGKRGKAEDRRAYSCSRASRSPLSRGSRQRRKEKSQLPAALGTFIIAANHW